jgi:Sec-independent protein translocase protein TatA
LQASNTHGWHGAFRNMARANEQQKQQEQKQKQKQKQKQRHQQQRQHQQQQQQNGGGKTRVSSRPLKRAGALSVNGVEVRCIYPPF